MLGFNNERMVAFNKSLLLFHLFRLRQASISQLANCLGLSVPAVSRLAQDLISEKKLCLLSSIQNGRGRKAGILQFADATGLIVCIEIRPNGIFSLVSDMFGQIVTKEKFIKIELSNKNILIETLESLISNYINSQPHTKWFCAIAIHGQVDSKHGISLLMPQLHWHEPVYIKFLLEQKLNIPVLVDNDCVMRGLAQKWQLLRGNKPPHDFCVLNLDYGIGSSFIINNQVYRGTLFGSGQIGHTIIDPNGRKCSCRRNGCLETEVSIGAIKRNVNESLKSNAYQKEQENLTFAQIIEKYLAQDPLICSQVNRSANKIGLALYNMLNVVNINHIYLYGRICKLGQAFLDEIKQEILFNPFDAQDQIKSLATVIEYGSLSEEEQLAGISFLFGEQLYKQSFESNL